MQVKYLIRLDDACPTMKKEMWDRIEALLDSYGIKPMVGIIPDNSDKALKIDEEDTFFWEKARQWQSKKWSIALHGYDHCYISQTGMKGLNPLWSRSEFAGVDVEIQKDKITKGVDILRKNGLRAEYFFAPSHTFDQNTLEALRQCSDIRKISDTIACFPYRYGEFTFYPQIGGHCSEIRLPGVWTFCLHPSTMSESAFEYTEDFIKTHHREFITFDSIDISNLKGKSILSRFLSFAYFTYRRIRKLQ